MKHLLLIALVFSLSADQKAKHPYELMICDYVKFELIRMDQSGQVNWRYKPLAKVWDFELTNNGKIIYSLITGPREFRCLDLNSKTIDWSWPYHKKYREVINITAHNQELIFSGQHPSEAIFMSLNGEFKKTLDVPTNFHSHHGELGNIYPLKNGHFLVQLWGEGAVIEIDHIGKEVWRYQVPKYGNGKHPEGCVQDVLRLDNGNTLIACGTQARIIEITPDKKIIWEFNQYDYPQLNLTNACALQLLKDGSIFVTNFLRGNTGKGAHAFILSKDRNLTWSLEDHENIRAASLIYAIENK